MSENNLTHFDAAGNAVMVDERKARHGREATGPRHHYHECEAFAAVESGTVKKAMLGVARVAYAIGRTKRTSERADPPVPPLPLTKVQIEFDLPPERRAAEARCTVKTSGVTGAEMEALTGVSTALLTIYDMQGRG